MANCKGMLLEKNLLIIIMGILVWFCPLSCWCRNFTSLELKGKQASQVSTYKDYTADLAINGDVESDLIQQRSCSHTNISFHPWWKVDIGTNHCLGRITLVNRGDCCNDRLAGAIVRAGIESDILANSACGLPVTSDQASIPGAHLQFVCDPPVVARFVSVDDDNTMTSKEYARYLTLCGVMVEEYRTEECLQAETNDESTTSDIILEDPSFPVPRMTTRMFDGKVKCADDPRPLLAVQLMSLMQCFGSCKMNNSCWSFDYVMTSGQCRLYDLKDGGWKSDDLLGCSVYVVVRG